MGFLSGKKKIDTERAIIEIKEAMNILTLRIRNIETRIEEERRRAREAMKKGDRTQARAHISIAVDLENRRDRHHQEFANLERTLMAIETARDQAIIYRAISTADTVMESIMKETSIEEIGREMSTLAERMEQVTSAEEMLAEDLGGPTRTLTDEERIDRQLESMEAEILLEKEKVLPPLSEDRLERTGQVTSDEAAELGEGLTELEIKAKKAKKKEEEAKE